MIRPVWEGTLSRVTVAGGREVVISRKAGEAVLRGAQVLPAACMPPPTHDCGHFALPNKIPATQLCSQMYGLTTT